MVIWLAPASASSSVPEALTPSLHAPVVRKDGMEIQQHVKRLRSENDI